jgi:methylglutamate dehydrogenase subunit B
MRINCCYCGLRSNEEFVYRGDATVRRPDGDFYFAPDAAAGQKWLDYMYLRDNPAGRHRELWQHVSGCCAWLVVTRDTVSHDIESVEPASEAALLLKRKGAP